MLSPFNCFNLLRPKMMITHRYELKDLKQIGGLAANTTHPCRTTSNTVDSRASGVVNL